MPRNATGGYTLPAGNPVVTGTLISSGWANPTMADIQLALTDSLSRSGNGGMLAPFKVPDGSNINPSLSFVNEATSGLYRFGNNDIRMAVGSTDRMRWQGAGTPPQIYDEVNDRWNDLGAGGVDWRHAPTIPAEVEQGVGYMTRGGQSTLMPASPITGQAVTFSDLDNDWSETNFLTLDGNGNTFTQGSQTTYDLDLKGAFAQFAYLDGQWQIVNFGRLSDAYGFDLDDYATLNLVNSKPNANLLINGGFEIAQRGTSGAIPLGTVTCTLDRWLVFVTGTGAGSDYIQGTDRLGYGKSLSINGRAGNTATNVVQRVESSNAASLVGGAVTFQVDIYHSQGGEVNWEIDAPTTKDNWAGQVLIDSGSFGTLSAGWNSVTLTVDNIPASAANGLQVQIFFGAVTTGNVALASAKLEIGDTATPYQARPVGEELALCQRYFQTSYVGLLALTVYTPNGDSRGSYIRLPVTMRVDPAVSGSSISSGVLWFGTTSAGVNSPTCTFTPSGGQKNGYAVRVTYPVGSFGANNVINMGCSPALNVTLDAEIY